jgi:hypothetical protein
MSCFIPESGHQATQKQCLLRANSGHRVTSVDLISNSYRLPHAFAHFSNCSGVPVFCACAASFALVTLAALSVMFKGGGNYSGVRVFAVTASNLIFLRLGIDRNRPARICIGTVVKYSQVLAHSTNLLIVAFCRCSCRRKLN